MKKWTIEKIDLSIEKICELIEESEDYEEIIELAKSLAQLITARALHY